MPAVRALGRPPRVDKKAKEGKATTTAEAEHPAPTVPTSPVDQHDAKLEMKYLDQKFDHLIKSMKQDATQTSQQNNKMLKAIT